jgi:hypothetical protein
VVPQVKSPRPPPFSALPISGFRTLDSRLSTLDCFNSPSVLRFLVFALSTLDSPLSTVLIRPPSSAFWFSHSRLSTLHSRLFLIRHPPSAIRLFLWFPHSRLQTPDCLCSHSRPSTLHSRLFSVFNASLTTRSTGVTRKLRVIIGRTAG